LGGVDEWLDQPTLLIFRDAPQIAPEVGKAPGIAVRAPINPPAKPIAASYGRRSTCDAPATDGPKIMQ
jgi:hypothetical protein